MKIIGLLLMATLTSAWPLFSQIVVIPDKAFLNALIEKGVDTNGDNLISHAEAEIITYLRIEGNWEEGKQGEIESLKGIEAFVNLDTLRCNFNRITNLDLSDNRSLRYLNCNENQITSLDVSGCTALTELDFEGNLLTSLDLSNNTSLKRIGMRDNPNLQKVCVWTMSFPPEGMTISTEGSPNVYFTIDCNIGR